MSLHLPRLSRPRQISSRYVIAALLVLVAMGVSGWHQKVVADSYTDQINTLSQKNAEAKQALNGLQNQAASYQQAIDGLATQIASLQTSIDASQQQQAKLVANIKANQDELDKQRAVLSNDIKTMYVDGTPDTMEMLASSKNLSDYVDKQEYRSRVQNKIQDTMVRINDLQKQLQDQKAQVEQLLKEQQTQQAQLDSDRTQQQQLLNYNESQQSAYTDQLKANNAQIAKLQAQQLAAYQKLTGGGTKSYGSYGAFEFRNLTAEYSCGGSYSYCWAGFDQYVSDSWGLGLARECVHYAADRAAQGLDLSPYLGKYWGAGNAENWPQNLGGIYTVDHDPSGGHVVAIVAWPGGGGHAMYVESVLADGWVHVSQMNWDVHGNYSEMDVKSSGVLFVHFP